jgi:hypothetical protein
MSGLEAPLREAAAACVHAYRVGSHALPWFVRADNFAKETFAVNMPGTGKEHPDRRHKLRLPLQTLFRAWIGPSGFLEVVWREREKF